MPLFFTLRSGSVHSGLSQLLAFLACCGLSLLTGWAQTSYVTPAGAGQQTGTDWANALPGTALQARLASATPGAVFRLGAGLYKPAQAGLRALSFLIPSGVQVYGGYQGSGPAPDQRVNFAIADQPSSTTLSGDIDNNNQLDGGNSEHVVVFSHASEQTRLDGVVITGGNAWSQPYRNPSQLSSHIGGGGVYNDAYGGDSSPTLENCLLVNNKTSGSGGALFNDLQNGSSRLKLINTDFINNSAELGGAWYQYADNSSGLSSLATNCRFLNNTAQAGGAVYTAVSFEFSSGGGSIAPRYINCSFRANTATDRGGAFYTTSRGTNSFTALITLLNCTLSGNAAPRGGAVYNTAVPLFVRAVLVISQVDLLNCIVWNNGGSNALVNDDYVRPPGVTSGGLGFCSSTNGLLEAGAVLTSGTDNRFITSSPFASEESLQLDACSPAINAGSTALYTSLNGPATDLAGNARIFPTGGKLDLGAYEYQQASACPTALRVTQYRLINADTDQPIGELTPGAVLNLTSLPTRHINIQAVTEPATTGSVVFSLSGQQTNQNTETVAPYALFSDNQGDYQAWTPAAGSYSLTATPYAGPGGTGAIGTPLTVSFTVLDPPSGQQLSQFWLINAETDQPIRELTDGQELDLSKLPTRQLNIRALTEPADLGSVVFSLSGRQSYQQVENVAPFALFTDNGGDYAGWTPELGSYSLTATPYSGFGGTGATGTSLTVHFTVINSGAARLASDGIGKPLTEGWQVRVLGNPVTGNEVVVEVRGAQGESLRYELLDGSGRSVQTHPIKQAGWLEHQTLNLGSQGAGLLFLRVSTPTHSQTVKILKQ
ncbi:T9SS type A sorting domain-containing protein [Spirosoma fluviale]|uniref:Por secretion system C-terminal sorting domain-containing protein n=1 Tax=Spirosoma fluviale TaxID=1597977 RepID=A0A286G4H8_9BACT|nr:T9SS type A sorting domain-containing protein [Spirosoma fluviale]SOD90460.1 Por secretion system C-terminal sorting domain-containing protein [Spirosoma fluviale]